MKINTNKLFTLGTYIIVIIILITSLHSVEEIHYLKSFFPRSFTVQEAYYASLVEAVKIFLISFPLIIGWLLLKNTLKK